MYALRKNRRDTPWLTYIETTEWLAQNNREVANI
jgi:hypothetical protein